MTPDPLIAGTNLDNTSEFLPVVARRLMDVVPAFKDIRVRRTWRGVYPMSQDGVPIVGWNKSTQGLMHATTMCGQGFMMGPALGEVLARECQRYIGLDKSESFVESDNIGTIPTTLHCTA
eukprot:CAMPEP_0175815480 /NCGR_PEP_ID=MMETSP0107_2-20121207/5984_1 /TAXON_ID=195067 ORGANISM="Goniomonas pacifica, Strain CCMP1869" /NCGR_SAMPLE_ID=MMETSP0107_2 /ASSEMBLY_ACC=CAM_ASM_000203 /LENGTH=119 /DNA_ID=CAMNT_0017127515 /DNA_START=367 /DNA_END=722 /DNA_ORIENTATION=+